MLTPTFTSCSSDELDGITSTDELTESELAVTGKLGKSETCRLVFPDKTSIKSPFDQTYCNFYLSDTKSDGTAISSLLAMSTLKEPKGMEALTLSAYFSPVDLQKLSEGSELNPSSVSLSSAFSSSSYDYLTLRTDGGKLYVRSIDQDYITLYLDHLKFDCSGGGYLAKGEFVLYGDLKLAIK